MKRILFLLYLALCAFVTLFFTVNLSDIAINHSPPSQDDHATYARHSWG